MLDLKALNAESTDDSLPLRHFLETVGNTYINLALSRINAIPAISATQALCFGRPALDERGFLEALSSRIALHTVFLPQTTRKKKISYGC